MDISVPADQMVKLKEGGKKDKYLDLAREWKKMQHECEEKLIVIDALETVTKEFIMRLGDFEFRGRVETIQTKAFLRLARNTEKNPEDLRRLAVSRRDMLPTQNLVE